jgi:hypothetical protein
MQGHEPGFHVFRLPEGQLAFPGGDDYLVKHVWTISKGREKFLQWPDGCMENDAWKTKLGK